MFDLGLFDPDHQGRSSAFQRLGPVALPETPERLGDTASSRLWALTSTV